VRNWKFCRAKIFQSLRDFRFAIQSANIWVVFEHNSLIIQPIIYTAIVNEYARWSATQKCISFSEVLYCPYKRRLANSIPANKTSQFVLRQIKLE